MVYLAVLVALLLLALKGYCGKKVSILAQDTRDNFLFNLIRMIFCLLVGLAVVLAENSGRCLRLDMGMACVCLLAGISNVTFLVGWMLAIQRNAMVTVDVTLTIGSLIPAILCALFFKEPLLPQKMIGFALIVIAAVILSGYNKTMKKSGMMGALYLAIAMLGDGMMAFSQQLFVKFYKAGGSFAGQNIYPLSVYHFYTYLFAALILFVLLFFILLRQEHKKDYVKNSFQNLKKPLPHIAVMAICLFAATYLQTVATGDMGMSSQILYPIIKGGCLITVNCTAMLFFGEKPTHRSVLGSFVAMAGIIVMSVL